MHRKLYNSKQFDETNAFFQAWLTLKKACISKKNQQKQDNIIVSSNTEHLGEMNDQGQEEALQAVLEEHSPKNILKRKKQGGRTVPDGPGRFMPTSDEWKDLMEETESKKAKKANPRKNAGSKKTAAPKKRVDQHKKTLN